MFTNLTLKEEEAFETAEQLNEEAEWTEFNGAFAKNSNFYLIW